MSQRTIFLSRLIGLYCVLIGLAMLANRQTYLSTVTALVHNPPVLMITGVFALSVGLAIILAHNVWSGGALPVIITLVGWISLVKGVIFLALPPEAVYAYFDALHYEQLFYVFAGLTLLIGVYLTYGGFKAR